MFLKYLEIWLTSCDLAGIRGGIFSILAKDSLSLTVKIVGSELSFFSFLFNFLFNFPFVLFLAYRARIRDSMVYMTKENSRRMMLYHIGTS